MKKRKKPRRGGKNSATLILNAWKAGKPGITAEQASEAATSLAKCYRRKYGSAGLTKLGRLGAAALWAKYTPAEKKAEMLRRSHVARTRRKARIAAGIATGPGRTTG